MRERLLWQQLHPRRPSSDRTHALATRTMPWACFPRHSSLRHMVRRPVPLMFDAMVNGTFSTVQSSEHLPYQVPRLGTESLTV